MPHSDIQAAGRDPPRRSGLLAGRAHRVAARFAGMAAREATVDGGKGSALLGSSTFTQSTGVCRRRRLTLGLMCSPSPEGDRCPATGHWCWVAAHGGAVAWGPSRIARPFTLACRSSVIEHTVGI